MKIGSSPDRSIELWESTQLLSGNDSMTLEVPHLEGLVVNDSRDDLHYASGTFGISKHKVYNSMDSHVKPYMTV